MSKFLKFIVQYDVIGLKLNHPILEELDWKDCPKMIFFRAFWLFLDSFFRLAPFDLYGQALNCWIIILQ